MPDVPDYLVRRRVEHVVQRRGQLDHAQARTDMSTRARADVDQPGTHVGAQLAELVARQRFEVGGRLNAIEKGHT